MCERTCEGKLTAFENQMMASSVNKVMCILLIHRLWLMLES